jgi:hypothetical protein
LAKFLIEVSKVGMTAGLFSAQRAPGFGGVQGVQGKLLDTLLPSWKIARRGGEPVMTRVFVSHSSRDRQIVEERVIALLNRYGIQTWYSPDSIQGAQDWEHRIKQGLADCDWFLVVVSKNSIASKWVKAEVSLALKEREGKVLPVVIDDSNPTDLYLLLGGIHYVRFDKDWTGARRDLLKVWSKELRPEDAVAEGTSAESADMPSKRFRLSLRSMRARLIFGACLVGLAILGYFIAKGFGPDGVDPEKDKSPGPPGPRPSTSDLQMVVSLGPMFTEKDPAPKEFRDIPLERHLQYEQAQTKTGVQIVPRMKYLDIVKAAGPVHGVDDSLPFAWHFPNLAVRILNHSASTLLPSHALVRVSTSEDRSEPLLVVLRETIGSLVLVNEGHAEVLDPKVTFRIAKTGSAPGSAETPKVATGKSFSEEMKVNLNSYVPAELADEDDVAVHGTIEYGSAQHRRQLNFVTKVLLQLRATHPAPPSFQYHVGLEVGKVKDYTVPLHYQGSVQPKETESLLIRVGSDRTAKYRFELILYAAQKDDTGAAREIGRQEVDLTIFVPRTQRKEAKQIQARK